jgi:hypothetical protein
LAGGVLARAARVFTTVKSWCGAKLAESPGAGENDCKGSQSGGGELFDTLSLGDVWMRNMFDVAAFGETEFHI